MRIIKAALVCLSITAFAMAGVKGSVTGGIAKILGDEGEMFKLGMNFDASFLAGLNDYIALGTKIGFNRFSTEDINVRGPFESFSSKQSSIIFEFQPTVKFIAPMSQKISYFIQPSLGFDLIISKAEAMGHSVSDSQALFGFGIETGFDLSFFEIKPGFKFEAGDGGIIKWFTVNAGIAFELSL